MHDSFRINCQYYDSLPPILRQIAKHLGIQSSVSSIRELVEELTPVRIDKPKFIILDHAETLLEMDPKALRLLCQLRRLSSKNAVSIVLASRKQWSEFGQLTAVCFPIIIEVSCTVDPAEEILSTASFGKELLAYLSSASKQQRSDIHFMASLTKQYASMIELALRESPKATFMQLQKKSAPQFRELLNAKKISCSSDWIVSGLSLVDKHILLAFYLASKIPPRNDPRIFSSIAYGKRRMKGQKQKSNEAPVIVNEKKKAVTFERFLAIFYHIYPAEITAPSRTLVLNAVRQLTEQRLVIRMTPIAKLDGPKFKCNLSASLLQSLVQETNFKLSGYLNYNQ